MEKSSQAFRTISEVADWLGEPQHVLRFWETKFTQINPVKRAGGRRYYRPEDMLLLGGIRQLLHKDGMTIKGTQKLIHDKGVAYVSSLSPPLDTGQPDQTAATDAGAEDTKAATTVAAAPAPAPVTETVTAAPSPQPEPAAAPAPAAPARPEPQAAAEQPTPAPAQVAPAQVATDSAAPIAAKPVAPQQGQISDMTLISHTVTLASRAKLSQAAHAQAAKLLPAIKALAEARKSV